MGAVAKCAQCGKLFERSRKHRRFCCKACRFGKCERCGKIFMNVRARKERRRKFCSRSCSRPLAAKTTCEHCGKCFVKANRRRRFCSRYCAQTLKPKKTKCSACGGPRGHYKGTYCTRCATKACAATALKKFGSPRARYLWFAYGITVEEFNLLQEMQGGKCAACSKRPADVVDHDHVTNLVRGLLCRPCNHTFGVIGDTVEAAARLLDYARHGAKRVRAMLKRPVGPKLDRKRSVHFGLLLI